MSHKSALQTIKFENLFLTELKIKCILEILAIYSVAGLNVSEIVAVDHFTFFNDSETLVRFIGQDAAFLTTVTQFSRINDHQGSFCGALVTIPEVHGQTDRRTSFQTATLDQLHKLELLLQMLWMVKDCSVQLLEAVYYAPAYQLSARANYEGVFTNARGDQALIDFTQSEFESALARTEEFISMLGERWTTMRLHGHGANGMFKSRIALSPYHQSSRFERAQMFAELARKSDFLQMKISMYVPLFECLLSSDGGGELTQKVSIRLGAYLGSSTKEKFDIYSTMKKAYDYRSKFIHGSVHGKGAPTPNQLETVSTWLDGCAREVLNRAITSDRKVFEQPDLKDFYDGLLFS